MRLVRSVCRPAYVGFSPRFQRCEDGKISSASLHSVLDNTPNLVNRSNILGWRRSCATSAASSVQEDRKPRKRISKNERRTMVETYVNEYRKANEGKFPSVLDTIKSVGGGYYAVRQIIQELIYNSKQSSADFKYTSLEKSETKENKMMYKSKKPVKIKDGSLQKNKLMDHETLERSMYTEDPSLEKSTKVDEISIEFEEVPQIRVPGKDTRSISKDIETSSSMNFQSKHHQQSSVKVEFCKTDEQNNAGAQSHHQIDKPQSSQDLDYEKEHTSLKDKVTSDALEQKAGLLESTEVSGRESQEVPPKYVEPQKKSSVWNDLKSFANGILSIWKRS